MSCHRTLIVHIADTYHLKTNILASVSHSPHSSSGRAGGRAGGVVMQVLKPGDIDGVGLHTMA